MQSLSDALGKRKKDFTAAANRKMPENMSLPQMQFWFDGQLKRIIRPRGQSDRTGFRRIGNWLVRGISDKKFGAEIFEVVLGYAVEAAGPESRNPAAVFMAILKKELGYRKS